MDDVGPDSEIELDAEDDVDPDSEIKLDAEEDVDPDSSAVVMDVADWLMANWEKLKSEEDFTPLRRDRASSDLNDSERLLQSLLENRPKAAKKDDNPFFNIFTFLNKWFFNGVQWTKAQWFQIRTFQEICRQTGILKVPKNAIRSYEYMKRKKHNKERIFTLPDIPFIEVEWVAPLDKKMTAAQMDEPEQLCFIKRRIFPKIACILIRIATKSAWLIKANGST